MFLNTKQSLDFELYTYQGTRYVLIKLSVTCIALLKILIKHVITTNKLKLFNGCRKYEL